MTKRKDAKAKRKPGRPGRPCPPGEKFQRWVVLGEDFRPQKARSRVRRLYVRCTCGSDIERSVALADLLVGRSTSCGCRRRERGVKRAKTLNQYKKPKQSPEVFKALESKDLQHEYRAGMAPSIFVSIPLPDGGEWESWVQVE